MLLLSEAQPFLFTDYTIRMLSIYTLFHLICLPLMVVYISYSFLILPRLSICVYVHAIILSLYIHHYCFLTHLASSAPYFHVPSIIYVVSRLLNSLCTTLSSLRLIHKHCFKLALHYRRFYSR